MSRVCCSRCLRPVRQCYCKGLVSCPAPVDLLILQHPGESGHALNTAKMVTLAVDNAEIRVGEDFSTDADIIARLEDPTCQPWLLFPKAGAELLSDRSRWQADDKKILFVLLDATWRKARKMVYLSPHLQALPCVRLSMDKRSAYCIRKVPAPGYLSTVEAAVEVLGAAGYPSSGCSSLLTAFERLIENQIAAMGESVYLRHYRGR